jgi:cold shock CspA family protein
MPTGTVNGSIRPRVMILQAQGGGKDVFSSYLGGERAGPKSLNEGRAIEFELVLSRGKTSGENPRVR